MSHINEQNQHDVDMTDTDDNQHSHSKQSYTNEGNNENTISDTDPPSQSSYPPTPHHQISESVSHSAEESSATYHNSTNQDKGTDHRDTITNLDTSQSDNSELQKSHNEEQNINVNNPQTIDFNQVNNNSDKENIKLDTSQSNRQSNHHENMETDATDLHQVQSDSIQSALVNKKDTQNGLDDQDPSNNPTNTPTGDDAPTCHYPIDEPLPNVEEENDLPPVDDFRADMKWLHPQYHHGTNSKIKKPDELENEMDQPNSSIDEQILDRIQGSIIGMALGDALGAHVEFRPRQFLVDKPVYDMESGGTWGLQKGQFTDDTSMALCLANSLIANHGFNPYDQLVRYKWWYKLGYMSSTGQCFDIGAATRQSIQEFENRQKKFAKNFNIPFKEMDYLSNPELLKQLDVYCSEEDVAGNGALMRLAPVPLFFYRKPEEAVELSGQSGQITHGDQKAYDACRYYGALIVAALNGYEKEQLLDNNFYSTHKQWFGKNELHSDIESIAKGSYKRKNGYDDGIRGKGYIVAALEAALWAFWSDENSFEKGALAAVNLGDDTDTTAAIYGQLAGAHYGYKKLPKHWLEQVYARKFMEILSEWIAYEGECYQNRNPAIPSQL